MYYYLIILGNWFSNTEPNICMKEECVKTGKYYVPIFYHFYKICRYKLNLKYISNKNLKHTFKYICI